MVMAVFAYIYHQSFVVSQSISVETILDQVQIERNIFFFSSFKFLKTLYFNLWNMHDADSDEPLIGRAADSLE